MVVYWRWAGRAGSHEHAERRTLERASSAVSSAADERSPGKRRVSTPFLQVGNSSRRGAGRSALNVHYDRRCAEDGNTTGLPVFSFLFQMIVQRRSCERLIVPAGVFRGSHGQRMRPIWVQALSVMHAQVILTEIVVITMCVQA